MKFADRMCAGLLFFLAIAECVLVPRNYWGRIWIFGTGLAMVFNAMLNLLRVHNGYGIRYLKVFTISANVVMLAWFIALMASIGRARTLAFPMIIVVAVLVLAETVFSLGKNA